MRAIVGVDGEAPVALGEKWVVADAQEAFDCPLSHIGSLGDDSLTRGRWGRNSEHRQQ